MADNKQQHEYAGDQQSGDGNLAIGIAIFFHAHRSTPF
jgi:hypothetical protein